MVERYRSVQLRILSDTEYHIQCRWEEESIPLCMIVYWISLDHNILQLGGWAQWNRQLAP